MVDDDETLLKALSLLMERAGYEVHEASNGHAACRLLDSMSDKIDAVISDVSMANGTGLDVMRFAHRLDPSMPVLLMTGVPSVETAVEALEAGAFKFLTKPVDPPQLLDAVKKAIGARAGHITRSATTSHTPESRARSDLSKSFDSALEQLWMAFQPVVDKQSHRVFAYEALVRSKDPTLGRPDLLFQAAETLDRVHELGQKIRQLIAAEVPSAPKDCKIFVNLHPLDLRDETLYQQYDPLSDFAERVVFEITERVSLSKLPDVEVRIARLRERGYAIAVDDLGEGYAALSSMAQLRPEVVKLDMSLVRGIEQDEMKQRLVAAVGMLCTGMGIDMIAEGVETVDECTTLMGLGATLLQGYLFARPQAGFASVEF